MTEDADSTIAHLYGLNDIDPWDQRSESDKALDRARAALRAELADLPTPPVPAFVDPPDEESVQISDASSRPFTRLSVAALKLSALIEAEPGLPLISFAARNRASGCWIALTSPRIATRLRQAWTERGWSVTQERVDHQGAVISPDVKEFE